MEDFNFYKIKAGKDIPAPWIVKDAGFELIVDGEPTHDTLEAVNKALHRIGFHIVIAVVNDKYCGVRVRKNSTA
jgi:hypothetical protein